jgi:hypothetical protein
MKTNPVFVAGLERSGTSLMFALLASHPNIAMTRRTNMWTYFYNQFGDLSQLDNFERCLDLMMRYKRLVVLEPDSERIRQEFWQGEPTYARLFSLVEEHYAERISKPRWGDKSLNTERYADPIFEAYPEARILHMMRDPRDRYASVIKRWKYRRGGIGAGTAMWLSSVSLAKRNAQQHPDRYKIVRYETLAFQPEESLREICDFIGEDFKPAMLTMQGAENFRDEGGNSSYGKRKPGVISTNSIGRFREILSKQEVAFVQQYAGSEMLAFNYPLETMQFTFAERLRFSLGELPVNATKLMAWRVRNLMTNLTGRRPLPAYRIVSEAGST